jgi:VanZ family protein
LTARRIVTLWGPVAALMGLLFLASESTGLPGLPRGTDKLLHGAAYAVLGVACLRACHGGLQRLAPSSTLVALALAVGYGLLDELHQATVPGREASLHDWLADAAGAGFAVVLVAGALALRARRAARKEGHGKG